MIDINDTTIPNHAKEMSKDLNNGNWIVLYHANWCPHCVTFIPIYKQFYKRVMREKLPIKIAAIEQTHHSENSIGYTPRVQGYPTLVNRNNGVESEPYNGVRDVDSLMNFAKSKCALNKKRDNKKKVLRITFSRSRSRYNSNKVKKMLNKILDNKKPNPSKKRKRKSIKKKKLKFK